LIFRSKLKAVLAKCLKFCIKVEAHEMAYLFRSELEEKEQTLAEVRTKFSKNKQILTSNWEQAEAEVSPMTFKIQCSGSGIRCLFDPWIRDG
jgi:hypothetical protein